ncbi:hypothetical protein FACS1894214_0240 [Planctomycetales bacterium]|nr:hypothetical protein FACS1894214_0240 [Planctomycetales bacterium]
MKKNIVSRINTRTNKLAAGVLALILGMFPWSANTALADSTYDTFKSDIESSTGGTVTLGGNAAQTSGERLETSTSAVINELIIDGGNFTITGLDTRVIDFQQFASSSGKSLSVKNLTITGATSDFTANGVQDKTGISQFAGISFDKVKFDENSAKDSDSGANGGGFYYGLVSGISGAASGSLTLVNKTDFTNNTLQDTKANAYTVNGAGLSAITDGKIEIGDGSFTGNKLNVSVSNEEGSGNNGGAMYLSGTGRKDIKEVIVSGNQINITDSRSDRGDSGAGAGIYLSGGEAAVGGSFSGNSISTQRGNALGGAVATNNTVTDLDIIGGSVFTGNYVTSTSGNAKGGALYIEDTVLTVDSDEKTTTTFTANRAGDDGGAVYILVSNASQSGVMSKFTFADTSFTNNTALNGKGGAIAMENVNADKDVAELYISAEKHNVEFTGNRAGGEGQDIYLHNVQAEFNADKSRIITIGSGFDSDYFVVKTGEGTLQINADSKIGNEDDKKNMLSIKEGTLGIGKGAVVRVAGVTVMEKDTTLAVELNDKYAVGISGGDQTALYTEEFQITSPVKISLTGYQNGKPEVECNQAYPGSDLKLYTLVDAEKEIDKSKYTVEIAGAAPISTLTEKNFLWYQEVVNDGNKDKIQIGAGLVWSNTGTNDHHGTFYISGGCSNQDCGPDDNCGQIVDGKVFTLNTNLTNNDSGNGLDGWTGKVLTKTGDGTLVLGGDNTGIGKNTYTGGTKVEKGYLVAAHQNSDGEIDSVGSGAVTVDAGAVFQVGAYGISCSSEGTKSLTANATLNKDNAVSGEGNFAVSAGTGTLTIDFANTYKGDTTVHSGTLKLKNLGGTGENTDGTEAAVTIKKDAVLDLAAGGNYNKQISGDGTLVKSTDALVTLTGENDHGATILKKGQTDISNNTAFGRGTVTMEKGTTAGFNTQIDSVANDFRLTGNAEVKTKNAGQTVLVSGDIYGPGKLTKTGEGTIELTGNNELFDGGLDINEGRVKVHSQIALGKGQTYNNSELEVYLKDKIETLDVDKIDSTNGKFIKSGNGGLVVNKAFTAKQFEMKNGNLTVALTNEHDAAVTATSGFDFGGSAALTGKVANSSGLARGEENGKFYLALDGTGSDFFSKSDDNAFIDTGTLKHIEWSTYQDGDKLFYKLWAESYSEKYADQLSYNGYEAATGADRIPLDDPINEALNRLGTADDIVKAFSELHGEIYKTAMYAEADMQRNFNETILRRGLLCEDCYCFKGFRGQARNEVGGRELWATFTGGGNFRSNINRYSGYNAGRWGVIAGLEQMFARGWFIGGAFGYDKADLSLSKLPSKDSFYAARFSGYLNYSYGQWSTIGFLGYAKNWHDVDRDITFMNQKAKSKFDDDTCTFGVETRYLYHLNTIDFIPTAGFTVVDVDAPYIEETGAGSASLRLRKDSYNSLRVPVGFRVNSRFDVQDITLRPELRMFYVSEWGDDKIRGISSFAADSSKTFIADSGISGHCGFRLGAGVEAKVFDRLLLGFDYDAEIWNQYSRHDVGAHLTVRW